MDLLDNVLLRGLPLADFGLLKPRLKIVQAIKGQVLLAEGEQVDTVYFPLTGMLSLLTVMNDGRTVETGVIGREGVAGAAIAWDLFDSPVRIVAHQFLSLAQLPAAQFRKIAAQSRAIKELCVRFQESLLGQTRIVAACNALHTIEERLCRRLLQSADRIGSETVEDTQELLAQMLGVRRTSVTDVASKLQESGAISYSRGMIHILDRDALMIAACECYSSKRMPD